MEEALSIQGSGRYPVVIRPSFTLGGTGGGIAYNREEFTHIVETALELSPDDVEGVRHGHRVKAAEDAVVGSRVRGVSTQGELVALMEAVQGEDGQPAWQPKKVFFTSE